MATEVVVVERINNQILVSTQEETNNTVTLVNTSPKNVSIVSSNFVFPTGLYAEINHTHTISDLTDFNSSVSELIPANINISSGRLTLTSNDPLSTQDTTSSTIYYSPYKGNTIGIYDTSVSLWKSYKFNELSMSLSALSIDTNYDVFIYYNNSNLLLEKLAWTSNTSRSIEIVYLDGIAVKNGEPNKRYLGTFRSTSSNSTTDTITKRFLFNENNKIEKFLYSIDNISHTYTNNTIRPYRNNTESGSTRVEFIKGLQNNLIVLICNSSFITENQGSSVGIGIDSTSSINTNAANFTYISGPGPLNLSQNSIDFIDSSVGYHYCQLLQSGSSVTTFNSASMKVILLC